MISQFSTNLIAASFVLIASIGLCSPCNADLIFSHGFEPDEEISYTLTPNPYDAFGSRHVWGTTRSLTTSGGTISANGGQQFFGMRDLTNNFGGGSFFHQLIFNQIDLTRVDNARLTFDHRVLGFDADDEIAVIARGVRPDGTVQRFRRTFSNGGWSNASLNLGDSFGLTQIVFEARQDGEDAAGLDNIQINGTIISVPEPATGVFVIACLVFAGVRRNRANV